MILKSRCAVASTAPFTARVLSCESADARNGSSNAAQLKGLPITQDHFRIEFLLTVKISTVQHVA